MRSSIRFMRTGLMIVAPVVLVIGMFLLLLVFRVEYVPYGLEEGHPVYGVQLPVELTQGLPWTTEEAFPGLHFEAPVQLLPSPTDERRWFVVERAGRVWLVDETIPTKRIFLDFSANVSSGSVGDEEGAFSIAFHPEFGVTSSPNRSYLYVSYTTDVEGKLYDRISRFTAFSDLQSAALESEKVLIDQRDRHGDHNGGALLFGPDRFLYVGVGDEGFSDDRNQNTQTIQKNFFSGILRIDVDQTGGTISHPPRNKPQDGISQHYYIPSDNPFIGHPGALEEFWALGLRNPYRLAFDEVTGELWVGDVGANRQEEINIVQKGGNHQWSYMEGTAPFHGTHLKGRKPSVFVGVETPPIHVYPHENGNTAIIGGLVYRGEKFEALYGAYVYGDYGSGQIRALRYEDGGVRSDRLLTVIYPGLSSLTSDEEGNIFVTLLGQPGQQNGSILKLVKAPDGAGMASVPGRLSQTGLFSDIQALKPAEGLVPYAVNVPYWVNGATTRRWIGFRPGSRDILYAKHGDWTFPTGALFVQHFELPKEVRQGRPIETRILVKSPTGADYGVSYKWNAEGTDAVLVEHAHEEEIRIGRRTIRWKFLNSASCRSCHNGVNNFVLAVNTRQLNRDYTYSMTGRTDNQLRTWENIGMLQMNPRRRTVVASLYDRLVRKAEQTLDRVPFSVMPGRFLPRLAPLGAEEVALEHRVRSYLDVNCAYCHRPGGIGVGNVDLRFETPLRDQGLIHGKVRNDMGMEDINMISPGNPSKSLLFLRMTHARQELRMPKMDAVEIDTAATNVINAWVRSLK